MDFNELDILSCALIFFLYFGKAQTRRDWRGVEKRETAGLLVIVLLLVLFSDVWPNIFMIFADLYFLFNVCIVNDIKVGPYMYSLTSQNNV